MDLGTWFLNGWGLAVLLAIAIIGWALAEHLRYRRQFRALERHLRDAVGLLSSIPTPIDFYQRIRTSGQTLEANPVVGQRWREYRATLLPARGEKPLRSPRPANEFFNEDLYRTGNIDVRAYEALPNQFVGVGLCLTFFGLIFSLFIAQDVLVASADTATAELSNLLEAASFKFITSVVALLASVIFVFAKNHRLYKTEKEIAAFCEHVERLIPPVTPEELAEESNQELARQGEQLEAANRILATGIADALEQKLTAAMVIATQPLIQTVQNMTERLSDVNRSALEHMAQRFSETLGGAAKEHTDRMAELVRSSADAIAETPDHIRSASNAMSDQLKSTVESVDQAFASWSVKMVEAGDAAATNLKDRTSEHADFLACALRQEGAALLEGISAVADELTAAPEKFSTAGTAFATTLGDASENIRATIDLAGGGIATALDEAAGKVANSVTAMDKLMTQTDAVASRLEGISTDLGGQLNQLFRGAEEITGRLAAVSADVSVAGDAAQSLGKMAEKMERLSADLGSAVQDLGKITELSHTATKETQLLVVNLGERAAVMERELEGFDIALSTAFEKVGDGFDQLGSRTTEYMAQLDTGFAQALSRFGGAIRELGQKIDQLSETGMRTGDALIKPQAAE